MPINRCAAAAILATVALSAACNARIGDEAPRDPVDSQQPPGVIDPGGAPPDIDLLLPKLDGYRTDDTADAGEVAASLDHGDIRYEAIWRRRILDEDGFAQGEVTVVTFRQGSGVGEAYLDHWYGPAPRSPERIGDTDMLRIDADPFPVLAWVTPTFIMTFQRGAARSMDWLRALARATAEQVEPASSRW
jgi:hypothetical protein